jgi:(p)ppGpp synthase/HD superfamily hydrolase
MELSTRFEDALVFAVRLHAHQTRRGSDIPYISHLLAVSAIVIEYGGNEDEAIAALLHDAVEDQGGAVTRQSILERFGPTVTEIVDGCSDTDETPKPPWQARKEAYIAHLHTASPSVLLVSAADKLHNTRSILLDYRVVGDEIWQRFRTGREGTLWYYHALLEAYKARQKSPLIAELERTVNALDALLDNPPVQIPGTPTR